MGKPLVVSHEGKEAGLKAAGIEYVDRHPFLG